MLTVRPIVPSTAIAHRNETGTARPDQQRGAQAQHRHRDDHGERDRGEHVVAEVVQHVADVVGLVLQVADLDRGRPARPLGLDHGAHLLDGLDDVAADPLLDLQRQRRAAVDPGEALRVLEGPPDLGDVRERDDPVAQRP